MLIMIIEEESSELRRNFLKIIRVNFLKWKITNWDDFSKLMDYETGLEFCEKKCLKIEVKIKIQKLTNPQKP